LGIGYIKKGGGTVAAIVSCIGWYLALAGGNFDADYQVGVCLFFLVIGIWSGNKVEAEWGKDSSKVVIDEVAGMCVSLLFIPFKWPYMVIGLVLFRFFDIAKPLYIRRLEVLPGGWGVMMDDIAAGICSNILLQVLVATKLL